LLQLQVSAPLPDMALYVSSVDALSTSNAQSLNLTM
jgi:hypothetical protein